VFVVDGVDRRVSYADLRTSARRVAAALVERGVRRGDVVALVLEDPEPFLITLLGASIAGLIPASVAPPGMTAEPAAYVAQTFNMLRATGARAVVTTAALGARFAELTDAAAAGATLEIVLCPEDLESTAETREVRSSIDDIAFIQFTSGSTSSPKGVVLTHANVAANIDAINGPDGLATTVDDSAVSWLPLSHDMGLVGMALGPLYASRPATFSTPSAFVKRPVDWLRILSRTRATVSFAPNFAYGLVVRRLRDRDLEGLDLSRWRIAGCGAEPIDAATLAAFADRLGPVGFRRTSFFPCYGLAEHVLAETLPPRHRPLAIDGVLVGCGRPLPGHRLRVMRSDGTEAGPGEAGEIALAGPSVMRGYWNDPVATAETIRDGWLHTGDLGYVRNGDLFVCGRTKDLIIAHGRKYHPQDLESAVDEVPGIRRGRVVAFGVPGESLSAADRVVIVVEATGTQDIAGIEAEVRRRVGNALGLFVDEIVAAPAGTVERTTSGKIRRTALKAWYEEQRAS
jgi:fatty-acyl-CoA synthase